MSIEQELKNELIKELKIMLKTFEVNIKNINDYIKLLENLDNYVEEADKK